MAPSMIKYHLTFLRYNYGVLASFSYALVLNFVFQEAGGKHVPDKVISNYTSQTLSDVEKSLLSKGLNYAILPIKLHYADTLAPFELLYRDVKNLDMANETRETLK